MMNDNKALLPLPPEQPIPRGPDLDDLIFQGEGWLTSDR
jgi:hypothetical protein